MRLLLFVLFVAIPLLELVLLIQLGQWIGVLPTIALVMATAFFGAMLAHSQGLRVWISVRRELAQGRMPVGGMVDGLMVLIGGIVLLTPGILTDVLGLALLFPPTRALFKRAAHRRFQGMIRSGSVRVYEIGDG